MSIVKKVSLLNKRKYKYHTMSVKEMHFHFLGKWDWDKGEAFKKAIKDKGYTSYSEWVRHKMREELQDGTQ